MNIPSTQANDFSAKWLDLISEFVIKKQCEEASELFYFYPNTFVSGSSKIFKYVRYSP
jgi:hypothetical protein